MNLQQLTKNQQLKKKLQNKKQQRIRKKLAARQREKANLDFSHLKTGKMEKTKIIGKKVFRTQVQRARKIEVKVQDNTNAGTFVNQSQQYLTILTRTRSLLPLNPQMLQQSTLAISSYALAHSQPYLTLELTMEKAIQCNEMPVLLRVPHGEKGRAVIVVRDVKGMEEKLGEIRSKGDMGEIGEEDLRVMDVKEFVGKWRGDKKFKKEVMGKKVKILCDFAIYAKSKLIKKLQTQKIPIFPLDPHKPPHSLPQTSYSSYLHLLLTSPIFLLKPGNIHTLSVQNRPPLQLATNIEHIIHQAVARLILRDKGKGNRLVRAVLRTVGSIPVEVYAVGE